MDGAPLPIISIPKETISECFEIKQEEKNYKLNIIIINQDITLDLLDEKELMKEYEKKLTLVELRQIHKIFSMFNSSQEFIDFMKALINNKKLSIKSENESKISIEFIVEYLYKQNTIEIDLNKKNINFELIARDLYKQISILNINYKNIVEENKILKEENKSIKERLNNLESILGSFKQNLYEIKGKNKYIKIIDSVIIETEEESDMIISAIKQTMNKEIKEIKKLYQATKDGGGDPEIFHQKCDNIPNTLILIKSRGNRRFGAFVSLCWKSKGNRTIDKYCFSFSLDKKKIYHKKNDYNYEISFYKGEGPTICINRILLIEIPGNPIKESKLKTNENDERIRNVFDGIENALSEDGNYNGIYANEYEVFQILF